MTLPRFSASATLYKSRGSYCGATHKSAGIRDAVVTPSAGAWDWIVKNIIYPVGKFVDENRSELCEASAKAGALGAAGACAVKQPWLIGGCVLTGLALEERLYDNCMSG